MPRYLGWAVVATALALAAPPGPLRMAAALVVSGSAAAVAGVVLSRRGGAALAWWCIAAGLAAHAGRDAAALAGARELAQGLALGTAAASVAAVLAFLLARHADDPIEALLDAGIAMLIALLVVKVSPLAEPLAARRTMGLGLAAEVIGVVVLAGLAGLGAPRRLPSLQLLLATAVLALAGSLIRICGSMLPPSISWPQLPELLAPTLAAMAVMHPSMALLTEPVDPGQRRVGPLRLMLLGGALLLNPGLVLGQALATHGDLRLPIGIGLLTLLVLARLGGLLRERERIRAAYVESELRFRAIVQHAFDVIAVVDEAGVVVYVSQSAGRILGRPPPSCVGTRLSELVAAGDATVVQAAIDAVRVSPSGVARVEVRLNEGDQDEDERWGDVLVANRLTDPSVGGIVVNLRDITERKRAELELSHLALHDPLTGLPNRARLLERIGSTLLAAEPDGALIALLFCDLDGFKAVNDRHGHDLGDRLLIAVAERLREALRDEDEATRLGGDEFVVLCSGVVSQAHVVAIAARVRSRLCEPFALRGVEVRIGCSVGIAIAELPGLRPEHLLRAADRAMYRAKGSQSGIAVHEWPEGRTDVDLRSGSAEVVTGS